MPRTFTPPETDVASRSSAPRCFRAPGMGFGHDLLLAMIMALAMLATLFLYR